MTKTQDQRMAAFTLDRMFRGGYFDITKVGNACRLMGRTGSGPAYERLRALHCVDWGDIPQDIMQMIPVWLNEVLGGPRLSAVQIPALREGNQELPQIEDSPGMRARLGKPDD